MIASRWVKRLSNVERDSRNGIYDGDDQSTGDCGEVDGSDEAWDDDDELTYGGGYDDDDDRGIGRSSWRVV